MSANYYYQPYDDDGWWHNQLGKAGSAIGQAIPQAYGEPKLVSEIGGLTGKMLGEEVGWASDNFDAIQQNFDTLTEQLNDPRTWSNGLDQFVD